MRQKSFHLFRVLTNTAIPDISHLNQFSILFLYRYKEYFESKHPYNYNRHFYYVLAVRLTFVLVFQYLVFFIVRFMDYIIPDVPYYLDVSIKRENYISKKCMSRGGASVTRAYDGQESMSSTYASAEDNMQLKHRGSPLSAENAV